MDKQDVLALFDKDQRIEIEYPEARKEILPHVVRFIRPAPGMNFVSYSWLDGVEVDQIIQEQIDYFCTMDQPYSWDVYDHDRPPELKDRLVAFGFEPEEPGALMVLDLQDAPLALLEPITMDIRPVTHRDQLGDLIHLEEQVWGGDFNWMKKRIGDHLEIPNYLSIYVAYVDEQAVSAGWVYFYPQSHFAGLKGGSTLPHYRKRGFYTAILATRLKEAIRRGYPYLFIDASPMSQTIVSKHGFQLLTYSRSYERKN